MRRFQRLSAVLKNGGFSLHSRIGRRFGIRFTTQCYIVTGIAIVTVLLGSAIDGSLFLPGKNIGLLQHPAIWAFFAIQTALPISIGYSLKEFLKARTSLRAIGILDNKPYTQLIVPLVRYLNLETRNSRCMATLFYSFGLIAFVWNTYQNQMPGLILPYDFWDSKNFFCGFWITRVYKLYLFVWFFPYITLLHVAILTVALRLVRVARLSGKLKLLPFHPDGVGGLGFFPRLVTRPLVIAVILGTMPTAAAFYIHRAADVTPLMGLSTLVLATFAAYFVPILALRSDIIETKRVMVEKLRRLQQASFAQVFESRTLNFEILKSGNESIDYFEKLCVAIENVSNYPHLIRLFGLVTLAMTPAVSALIGKLYLGLEPVIHPWLLRL